MLFFQSNNNEWFVVNDPNNPNIIGKIVPYINVDIHKEARYYGLTRNFLRDSDYFNKLYERLITGITSWLDAQNKPIISSLVYHTYRLKHLNDISYEDYKQKEITFIPRQGITKGLKVSQINGKEVILTDNPENYLRVRKGMELRIKTLSLGIVTEPPIQSVKSKNNKLILQNDVSALVESSAGETLPPFVMKIDHSKHNSRRFKFEVDLLTNTQYYNTYIIVYTNTLDIRLNSLTQWSRLRG